VLAGVGGGRGGKGRGGKGGGVGEGEGGEGEEDEGDDDETFRFPCVGFVVICCVWGGGKGVVFDRSDSKAILIKSIHPSIHLLHHTTHMQEEDADGAGRGEDGLLRAAGAGPPRHALLPRAHQEGL
jgi:hypothetical protein